MNPRNAVVFSREPAVNTEVGGPRGNYSGGVHSGTYQEQDLFASPNGNTRVRGLTNADNTRNYFLSDVPWDGYTVSRIDLQRGPNAILFGLGSPAGVVNATTNAADFRNHGRFEVAFDKFSSQRYVLDYNRELIDDQLAARISLLRDHRKFRQAPAHSNDDRVYAALKYKPDVLNQNGVRFEISGNFEHGKIRSNRPRTVTSGDFISGFWDPESEGGLNQQTYDGFTEDHGNEDSPDYTQQPGGGGIGGTADRLINSHSNHDWIIGQMSAYGSLRPDGSIIERNNDDANGVWPRSNATGRVGVRRFPEWASVMGLPFANFGAYSLKTITDPNIFDFYNTLLDGPNKGEWTDWDVLDLNLTNTYFNDTIGFDLSYYRQELDRGQRGLLGWNNELYIDVNETLNRGLSNPDLGRAYVTVENRDGGNGETASDRDAARLQLFAEYDAPKRHEGLLGKIIGRHRFTGVLSNEHHRSDSRSYRYADFDYNSKLLFNPNGRIEGTDVFQTGFRYYISDDLRGNPTGENLHLGNLSQQIHDPQGGDIDVFYFDKTWTATGVDPAAPWANPDRPGDTTFSQSNNPGNYLGWTNRSAHYVTIHSDETVQGISAKDYLTSSGTLNDFDVDSKVLVWQGFLLNSALVGTYGYREDSAKSYLYQTSDRNGNGREDTGSADLNPSTCNFSRTPTWASFRTGGTRTLSASAMPVPGLSSVPTIWPTTRSTASPREKSTSGAGMSLATTPSTKAASREPMSASGIDGRMKPSSAMLP
ncbi:MAG: hypothetical protein ACREIA_13020 [Opitutaceae bacterium]